MRDRTLFVFRKLAHQEISVPGLREGREGLSGTEASCLLVADGLARRGHQIALWVRNGSRVDTAAEVLEEGERALHWARGGRVVICTWQETLLDQLGANLRPWVWTQLPISPAEFAQLAHRRVEAVVVVSDTMRLPFLHSSARHRIGRVYNPLNPYFMDAGPAHRRRRLQVAFTGYIGESKGVHRLLEMWPHVREHVRDATLLMAGSHRLYGSDREVGPFGIADPVFEREHLMPLANRFGSLAAAGVDFVGLKSPSELKAIYAESAVGVVNPNWHQFTETFCCAAVEMMATGLPVFGMAAGALPETIGRSGGAMLVGSPDLRQAGQALARLLTEPSRLAYMGSQARRFATLEYDLPRILDAWERLLGSSPELLGRSSGGWQGPRGLRYYFERVAGATRLGRPFRAAVETLKRLLRLR